jgi:hypothetical protein
MKDRFLIDAVLILSLISLHILLFAILIYQIYTNDNWVVTALCIPLAILIDILFYLHIKDDR